MTSDCQNSVKLHIPVFSWHEKMDSAGSADDTGLLQQ